MFFSLDRVNGGSGFLTASFLGCLLVPAWHHLDLLPRKSTSHWRKILTTNLFWPLYREKMWICFCFFVANKIIVFFFVWFLFYIFLVHTRFKYGRIFQHILLPRNPTFPFQPTGGGKASKAQWCKQGWTLNITSKGFSFWNKNPMVS